MFGLPELFILGFIGSIWIVPVGAAVWALVTLYKMRGTLDRIEQHLRSRGGA